MLAWSVFGLARPDWFQNSGLATVVYVITMPLGFWFFFLSLWVVLRSKSA
jgi:hypothetical protein